MNGVNIVQTFIPNKSSLHALKCLPSINVLQLQIQLNRPYKLLNGSMFIIS